MIELSNNGLSNEAEGAIQYAARKANSSIGKIDGIKRATQAYEKINEEKQKQQKQQNEPRETHQTKILDNMNSTDEKKIENPTTVGFFNGVGVSELTDIDEDEER